jgi:hypothetical protein
LGCAAIKGCTGLHIRHLSTAAQHSSCESIVDVSCVRVCVMLAVCAECEVLSMCSTKAYQLAWLRYNSSAQLVNN